MGRMAIRYADLDRRNSRRTLYLRMECRILAQQMEMKRLILILLLIGSNAMADLYRVHYSIRGSGKNITVNAESSAEARRVVMDMFPGAVVTGAHKIRK
jgi:hypothetical protein